MFSLLKKEIVIQKKILIFSFPIVILYLAILPLQTISLFPIATLLSFFFIINANDIDEKNKSNVLLNSLPISREQIVAAKYISVFVFALISIIIANASGLFLKILDPTNQINWINIEDVLRTFCILGGVMTLYYPLYFKFGGKSMLILLITILVSSAFVVSVIVSTIGGAHTPILYILDIPQSYLALLICILFYLSFQLSLRIYRNKDF